MHPAYSVIVFTCASGAGYGMLVWLGVAALAGTWGPRSTGMTLAALGLSFFLVTIGLLSSTLHLGRPERAWRAFSQWRSSWLSREGVMALVTYAVGGMFALVWLLDGHAAELLVAGARPADGAGRGRDPVVHRHDLRLAHHHSGVEPSPGRPALRAARTDHRPGGAQCDRGDRTGWHLDARRLAHAAAADGRVDRQDHLLERHRRSAPHAHRRRGDGARPVRTGATARPATHASQFRDARDGLSGGAQACRAAAADRGAAVVRGAGRA